MPSAAAIFIGCSWSSRRPWPSPKPIASTTLTSPIGIAIFSDLTGTALTPSDEAEERADRDDEHRCRRPCREDHMRIGEQNRRVQEHREDVVQLRLVGRVVDEVADGCCIHEFAGRMK